MAEILLEKQLLTVQDYYKMAEDGLLDTDSRFELINGKIITMSPIKSPHGGTVNFLSSYLNRHLPLDKILVITQNAIRLNEHSEPEPDIVIAKFTEDYYRSKHPMPEDIFVVIEVSDTTLTKDRRIKKKQYAEAGILEYWIVNLLGNCVEVHWKPEGEKYKEKKTYYKGETIEGKAYQFSIEVDKIFPDKK